MCYGELEQRHGDSEARKQHFTVPAQTQRICVHMDRLLEWILCASFPILQQTAGIISLERERVHFGSWF
jgi:hypothetical protein